jgi:hypothetical protein
VSWLRRVLGTRPWDGSTGRPRSANGASSFHLAWQVPEGEWFGARSVLEVVVPPAVAALHFWAMQVSFVERGRAGGGAHLGLQWYPPHPGSTAVNWGGYRPDGRELDGSASTLPSATDNVNTRDYSWRSHRAYGLEVRRGATRADGTTAWQGIVTDLTTDRATTVRELYAHGSMLVAPMVWSEIFADCDAPAVEVHWHDLAVRQSTDRWISVRSAVVNYQPIADGGCSTTDSSSSGSVFVQRTGTSRHVRQGTRLELS